LHKQKLVSLISEAGLYILLPPCGDVLLLLAIAKALRMCDLSRSHFLLSQFLKYDTTLNNLLSLRTAIDTFLKELLSGNILIDCLDS
jgi:hypothetical protein